MSLKIGKRWRYSLDGATETIQELYTPEIALLKDDIPESTRFDLAAPSHRVTREMAFGYIDMPKGAIEATFAQCAACAHFTGDRCLNFRPSDKVVPQGACNLYVYGMPTSESDVTDDCFGNLKPKDAGYVVDDVRCANCSSYHQKTDHGECELYEQLNKALPTYWKLEEHVKPSSCCNSWSPSSSPKRMSLRLSAQGHPLGYEHHGKTAAGDDVGEDNEYIHSHKGTAAMLFASALKHNKPWSTTGMASWTADPQGNVTVHTGYGQTPYHDQAVSNGHLLGKFHVSPEALAHLRAIDKAHDRARIGGTSHIAVKEVDQSPALQFADYLYENGDSPEHSGVAKRIRDHIADHKISPTVQDILRWVATENMGGQRMSLPTVEPLQLGMGPHKFANTQINLPPELAGPILALASQIPNQDLAKDGRESQAHVTVKYGLHQDDPAAVKELLKDEKPVRMTLGRVSLFPAKEGDAQRGGSDFDVLKVDVDSSDLHRINAKLCDSLEHTDTFPRYCPHITIAYLRPGLGKKYVEMWENCVVGKSWEADRITFCAKDGTQTDIPVGEPCTCEDAAVVVQMALPDGLAKGKPDEDFDPEQLRRGAEVEREHTRDPKVAKQIAKDHLVEDASYYRKLEKMESNKNPAPGVYLFRHGKTKLNTDGESPDLIRGWLDVPLDDGGKKQAEELAPLGKKFDIREVYSSDLQRTRATADAIAEEVGVSVDATKALRPWNLGEFQGKSAAEAAPKLKEYAVDRPNDPVPGGESFEDYCQRYLPFLRQVMDDHEKNGDNIALVTHYRNCKLAESWFAAGIDGKLDGTVFFTDDLPTASVLRLFRQDNEWKCERVGAPSSQMSMGKLRFAEGDPASEELAKEGKELAKKHGHDYLESREAVKGASHYTHKDGKFYTQNPNYDEKPQQVTHPGTVAELKKKLQGVNPTGISPGATASQPAAQEPKRGTTPRTSAGVRVTFESEAEKGKEVGTRQANLPQMRGKNAWEEPIPVAKEEPKKVPEPTAGRRDLPFEQKAEEKPEKTPHKIADNDAELQRKMAKTPDEVNEAVEKVVSQELPPDDQQKARELAAKEARGTLAPEERKEAARIGSEVKTHLVGQVPTQKTQVQPQGPAQPTQVSRTSPETPPVAKTQVVPEPEAKAAPQTQVRPEAPDTEQAPTKIQQTQVQPKEPKAKTGPRSDIYTPTHHDQLKRLETKASGRTPLTDKENDQLRELQSRRYQQAILNALNPEEHDAYARLLNRATGKDQLNQEPLSDEDGARLQELHDRVVKEQDRLAAHPLEEVKKTQVGGAVPATGVQPPEETPLPEQPPEVSMPAPTGEGLPETHEYAKHPGAETQETPFVPPPQRPSNQTPEQPTVDPGQRLKDLQDKINRGGKDLTDEDHRRIAQTYGAHPSWRYLGAQKVGGELTGAHGFSDVRGNQYVVHPPSDAHPQGRIVTRGGGKEYTLKDFDKAGEPIGEEPSEQEAAQEKKAAEIRVGAKLGNGFKVERNKDDHKVFHVTDGNGNKFIHVEKGPLAGKLLHLHVGDKTEQDRYIAYDPKDFDEDGKLKPGARGEVLTGKGEVPKESHAKLQKQAEDHAKMIIGEAQDKATPEQKQDAEKVKDEGKKHLDSMLPKLGIGHVLAILGGLLLVSRLFRRQPGGLGMLLGLGLLYMMYRSQAKEEDLGKFNSDSLPDDSQAFIDKVTPRGDPKIDVKKFMAKPAPKNPPEPPGDKRVEDIEKRLKAKGHDPYAQSQIPI